MPGPAWPEGCYVLSGATGSWPSSTFRLALEPTSNPDTFVAEQGSFLSGENVTFHRRADGRVISVLLVASTFLRLDPVPASE
jgi:hypothetical protein